jgi:hypothetical protein
MATVLIGVGTTAQAQAQLLQTELPFLLNEAAGTGYPGSEVAGEVDDRGKASPALVSGIPTAYGAEFGDVFGGAAYQRYLETASDDGAIFLGAGAGNAREAVGIEVTHTTYDLVGDPLSDGSISFKLHRRLYEGLAIAVGIESAVKYGGDLAGTSAYAVASHTVEIDGGLLTGASATVGIGDGRFNTMSNLAEGKNRAGWFGGMSLQWMDCASVLGTWYGQDLNLGLSVVAPGPIPVTVTPVWSSVLGRQAFGDRFALSIGASYQFL